MSEIRELGGTRVLICDAHGAPVAQERDAVDLIGEALSADAVWVALPLARLPPDFLDLRTCRAGEVLQKFVNYGRQVALVGDMSRAVAASDALGDFVRESNRGRHVWFVADLAELEARLGG